VRPFLAAADIGLLTSKSEGSSNSVLEYMAMGLPAVLSDIPSNRELVNEVFFVPGDSGDLGDKILRLYGKPDLRARMSREYRQRAVQYGLEAFAPRAQTYYFRLAAEFL
jgi:glycosyltransferase involved in cell wall biosynthesis